MVNTTRYTLRNCCLDHFYYSSYILPILTYQEFQMKSTEKLEQADIDRVIEEERKGSGNFVVERVVEVEKDS